MTTKKKTTKKESSLKDFMFELSFRVAAKNRTEARNKAKEARALIASNLEGVEVVTPEKELGVYEPYSSEW